MAPYHPPQLKTLEGPLINRVAKSKLITIDLGKFYPTSVAELDLSDHLFKGLMLREKDFRASMKALDFSIWSGDPLHVHCSTDAIIPMWAHMLVASYAAHASVVCYFDLSMDEIVAREIVRTVGMTYTPEKVKGSMYVLKGCSDHPVHPHVYGTVTDYLVRHGARTVMFGEPCSTVPIYKRPKATS